MNTEQRTELKPLGAGINSRHRYFLFCVVCYCEGRFLFGQQNSLVYYLKKILCDKLEKRTVSYVCTSDTSDPLRRKLNDFPLTVKNAS